MPTDNPKISLYVPQAVYDRFNQFKDEQGLSMSQAGIVILAEYFQLKEIIKETAKGTTIGGVTLARVEAIEEKSSLNSKLLKELLNKVEFLENSLEELLDAKNKPVEDIIKNEEVIEYVDINLQLNLQSNLPQISKQDLAKRLGLKNPRSLNNIKSDKAQELASWTASKDPDGIAWRKIDSGKRDVRYSPLEDTASELLSKLKQWITYELQADEEFRTAAIDFDIDEKEVDRLFDDTSDPSQTEKLFF